MNPYPEPMPAHLQAHVVKHHFDLATIQKIYGLIVAASPSLKAAWQLAVEIYALVHGSTEPVPTV